MNALDLLASCTTLDDLLRWRATEQPDLLAYTFLLDGEAQEARLTYGQLDRRARAIGATLASRGARGARVLLLYAPGFEYAVAVLGCLYAGAVAVPAYPPDPARLSRTLPRLLALIADSKASFALTTSDILPMAGVLAEQSEEMKALVWLATDDVDDASAGAWRDPGATRDTLAILQYTSGSTAAPRGVMLTHGNLLHNLAAIHRCFEHTSESRGVIWLPPYHDMGLIGGVLQPLFGGFPVVLMSPIDFLRRPFRWLQAISRYRATTSGGPNFAYDLCVRKITREEIATLDLSSWDLAFNGAEPVRAETLERFAATFEPCGFRRAAFYPCYGLAEATLIVSGASKERSPTVQAFNRGQLQRSRAVAEPADPQRGDGERLVGCGATIPGHEVLVVDPGSMTAAPPGHVGEIWVSGASVARGYWNRPEETAETFGARLKDRDGTFLRTGDLGFLQGGELFVTGRSKDLIILRGRNHYPQDIELTVERSHPAVRQGCSAAFSVEAAAEERLVVVAEINVSGAPDVAALVSAVRSAVAEQHELQVHAVVLLAPGGIPKTSSGKIQRRACRAGFLSGELNALTIDTLPLEVDAEPEPGRGPLTRDLLRSAAPEDRRPLLEEHLSRQVARVLGIAPSRLDPRRSLSSLGLDSIQVIELKNAVEADLGLTVPMSSFLVAPGVAEIAAQLLVELESSPDARVDSIQPVPREGGAPLSFAQERFWFLDHLQPGSCASTIFVAALLEGPLDAAALAQGFDALVRRHESLRTTFPAVDGTPLQVIAEAAPPGEACPSPFGEIVDLGGLPARERDAAWRRLAHAEARQPFDLSGGPLLRVRLLRLAPREHVVLLAIHHIVADGWSMGILVRELFALYECFCANRRPSLLDLPIQYADFAGWQRRREEALEADLVYWKRQLGGSLPMLDLPADRPRPPLRTTLGATRSMALPRDLSDALRELCRAEGVTLFMLLFAAFNALLHRYTGQEEFVVGSPIAGRSRAETEGLIGCFINMLALRVDLSGAPTFLDLLTRVRGVTLGAYAHQELPFERLVEALKPDRDPSRTPIFQVVFVLQNAPMPELSFGDLTLRTLETGTGGAAFDMTMTVTDRAEGMQVALEYSADLFDAATIGRLLDHFRTLLQGIAADPARRIVDLPLLTAEERQTICVAWNQTARTIEQDACVHHLIEAAARRRPHAGAVVCGDQRLDHEQLDRRSNQLANHLRRRGVGPGALVGICLERSLDMVVGLLGILKAGGAYVPLDPAYPRERLSFIMSDAQLAVLVTEGRLAQALPDGGVARVWLDADRAEIDRESTTPPAVDVRSGSLAYVIYTSGSTGTPKGVEITHHSVVNLLTSMRERPGLGERDRLLAVTSLSFDIAALDIFLPLSTGALLEVASRELSVDGAALSEHLSRAGITVLQATPATFRLLLEAGWEGSKELKILVGGEALPRELADALVDRAASVWNLYGPTETTIYSCGHPIAKGPGPVPIGRPIANTRVYVLSDRLHPLPVGIPGELYIGGAGLARGYHRRPDLTAERFVDDPFAAEPGGRMYRTGDLVKWLPDGTLEFLGRLDHQVKIRGFRIELGEIESVLGAHPAVGQAVVVAREDRRGDRRLVAYLTARGSGAPTPGELRAHLKEKLPEYMIPSAFVALEAMPLTPNGKVDRRALPAPEPLAVDAGGDLAAPRTPVEEVLAGIWAHVLGLERVGAHDDFFQLGGHSLLAAQVLARLRSAFRIDLPLRALFEAPTLAGLAERVEAAQRASAGIHRPPLRSVRREGALPLSFAQQRLWFLAQLEPDSAFYNIPGAARIQGPLDRAALEESIQEVARRHEALRTTVALVDGTPRQVIAPDARLPFEIIDLRALVGSAQEAEVRRRAADEARQPFDLARGPLARAKLLQLGDAEHVLLLTMHHIISDGWSVGVLLKELAALYPAFRRGEPSPLSALPIQYGDFAVWQRRWLEGEAREEQLAYWKGRLAGAPPYLDLPTDRPRPAVQRFRGATLSFQVSGELTAALARLSRRASVTPFMTLLAGFQVLLGRYAGVEEVCVGTPVAGRNRMELEGLIGMFVNTLVLRTNLSGAPSFEELLSRVREVALGAFEHQDVPFDQVVDVLQPPRDLSRSPLFQVAFALQNAPLPPLVLEDLMLSPLIADSATSKVDLSLMLAEAGEGMQGWLEYNTDLFDEVTIERMAKRYVTLLESAARDPGQRVSELQMLPEFEREELLRWSSAAAAPSTRGAPASAAAGASEPQEYVAPRTPIEETLAEFWREVLGVERVGAHDDFFDLGGNSLSSTLVLVRIQETWGVEVPARRIFQTPTLAAFAAAIESEQAAVGRADDGATPRRPAYPPLVPVARSGDSPVSFGQQRLWFLNQLEPDSSFYNIPAAVRIRGPLDTEALERSLREIVARHEVLRTTIIAVHGQPRQVIAPESALALPVVELGAVGETEREQLVQRRAAEEAQRPFNLARGPLLRAELLRLEEQEHVLLLTMHHIISDGWSVGVLLKELAALYPAFRRGEPSPLSALPIQYGDFAVWQRRWLEGEAREEQLAYWKRHLSGAPPYLELPTDRPRPAMQRFRGATLSFQVSGELTAALARLSRRASVTPFMTLLAGFQVLLGRYAGVEEVCVGTPVAGRNRMELEGLIGMFVNTLVLRTDLSGAPSFEELLSRVREVALGAFEHQDVPFDQVVDVLQPPRDLSRSPLFQVAFALQNAPLPPLVLEELTLSPLIADSATSKVDLSLMLAEAGEGMQGWLEYNTDLFDGETVERMAKRYLTLLESAARDPGQRVSELQMLPEFEREELLRWSSAAAAPSTRGAPASAAAGASEPQEYVAPRTPIEETLAQFWREVLGVERVGAHDNFFELGGNSLSSTLVLVRIQETWGVEVPAHRIFQAPTLAALAAAIESEQAAVGGADDGAAPPRPAHAALVCMQAGRDDVRPWFFVHGAGGSVLDYAELVRHLDPARPFYGIHAPWLDGDEALPASVEAMARSYLSELRKTQPSGPYLLGGWSFGGVVAFEMAQQLRAAGESVAMLALVDSYAPTPELAPAPDELTSLAAFCSMLGLQGQFLKWDIDHLRAISPRDRLTYVLEQARGDGDPMVDLDQAERWYRAFRRDLDALLRYTPSPYPGAAALFRAETTWGSDTSAADRGWSACISAGLATYSIPGDHRSMLRPPHVAVLAEALTRHMNDAERYACATRSVHRDGRAVGSARPI
ncbi:amino acid adenylation domain-containing protein [Sorangium sp. So ce1335]|uniref:amino acid adenylation domain-containing protein n=1 Tax=Sorangium sp. So ce1335 TaxID=3133335 RepID=UPI003F600D14